MLESNKKQESESFHEYVLKMRKIAALGVIEEKSVIRYIIDGLRIKDELKYQMYTATSYKELREKYEIFEMMNFNRNFHNKFNKSATDAKNKPKTFKHCYNCGSTEHKRSECKSLSKCFNCNKFGHIAKNCNKVKDTEKTVQLVVDQSRFKIIYLNNVEIKCLVDTGSDISIIKYCIYKKYFASHPLKQCKSVLRGLGNSKTQPIGCLSGTVRVDNIITEHDFLIIPDNSLIFDGIIGYDFIRNFILMADENGYIFKTREVIQDELKVYNVSAEEIDVDFKFKDTVSKLILNYNSKKTVEECPVKMHIVPNEKMKPFRHAPSRLALAEEEALNLKVEEWLKTGIIRKSTSDTASRVVVTKKKNGSFRICIDFRQLNTMVLKDAFPVPIVDEVLQKLANQKFFITMDLENGFFHVTVDESSRKYTAFVTKRGLFEFNKAPFGFCNSPACFVRYVNYVFQDLINEGIMDLYIDDIIIYGKIEKECINKLERVLDTAARYGLKFNWAKCSFLKTKIEFLGHVVENGKISPSSAKIKAVANVAVPKNIKDVQSFLGLTGYFRKFIEGYAQIVRPLTDLLKKDAVFRIGQKELDAMNRIKQALISEPVLRLYDREAETELHTDASKNGFGAALMQKYENRFHPVFFYSRKTSPQESRLHSYILEVKAAYLALKKFRQYLLGINFQLVTDCAAFKQTIQKRDIPRDVAQWVMYLQDFTYTVEHRTANRLKHVDHLSRYPVDVMIISSNISARFKTLQNKDEYAKAVAKALESGSYENYKLKGGLVYKCSEGNDLLLVPKTMESEIIRNAHMNGHFAKEKTMHTIRQKYFIPHLERKVEQVINNCVECIIYNKKTGKKDGYLNCIEKGSLPLHTIHVDHLGPLDATSKQYKYIFATVDSFSKFVWLYVTKTTSSEEVIRHLQIWSDVFGFPCRVISDRGSAFTSKLFEEFCSKAGIEHVITTTGVPRSNGQIERVNRVILSIISKLSQDEPAKWFKYIGRVQKAINSSVHCSTKTSPFEIMFGTKMKTNIDANILEMLENELIENYNEERQQMRAEAKKQIEKAQETYKRNFDKKRKDAVVYSVGDLVAVKRTQFVSGRKLASEYLGPYEVTKVKRNNRYEVRKVAESEGPNSTSTSSDYMKRWVNIEDIASVLSSGTDDYQDGRM